MQVGMLDRLRQRKAHILDHRGRPLCHFTRTSLQPLLFRDAGDLMCLRCLCARIRQLGLRVSMRDGGVQIRGGGAAAKASALAFLVLAAGYRPPGPGGRP